ncbi:uncharacterized protein LOC113225820 isoform X2 [Hyposmocoma kahamanoa]|uniref:uncharacterized protein LOC113225820 isoform X2 n=1 Tax=Hyposmocoma kahamanoa TaxID=1477025 RepID=UPI000E6D9F84|nr:uncharacterized protein LOC113225820 isoform X2 [Hyposmocoma kahamanoa]
MNDPWDVKSVRRSHQYQSFMKINGVPLLPPVLSKECRKEMQYYKLLAKEVEKRIKTLRPYLDMEPVEVVSGAMELSEAKDKVDDASCLLEGYCHPTSPLKENVYNAINSNATLKTTDPLDKTMDMMFGINVSIKNTTKCENSNSKIGTATIELPERDYNCPKKPVGMLLNELNQSIKNSDSERKPLVKKKGGGEVLRKKDKGNLLGKNTVVTKASTKTESEIHKTLEELDMMQTLRKEDTEISDISSSKVECNPLPNTYYNNTEEEFIPFKIEGTSLRSFTGSLHDINADCSKDSSSPLVRQRSYTVLKPSPLLIQHLELQARNMGVDFKLISMSESLSNIPQLKKKKRRRSWDLETAKSQWSSMALDLKKNTGQGITSHSIAKTCAKQQIPSSYTASKYRKPIPKYSKSPKSDPIQRSKFGLSKINVPLKNNLRDSQPDAAMNKINKNDGSPKPPTQIKESSPKISDTATSAANDPATKVRELYEKIQKQQLDQMACLVEKQKQEQILLQQVFDEQNNMLFKQLKSICPEPTVEIKQAWCDKEYNAERGPVSLSELINHTPTASGQQSPVAKTLVPQSPVSISPMSAFTFPGNYSHCGDKLKRSGHKSNVNHYHNARPQTKVVTEHNSSRKLNYDNSGMTSDNELLLTDQTNDTMADLNVSFPTDNSEENNSCKNSTCQVVSSSPGTVHRRNIISNTKCTNNAIRSLENSIQKTMHAMTALTNQRKLVSCTTQQREAATKIVAYAKGYLVRRLMRTERVQATVATIHDALLCALQLHQDREGIRGADVDLHRRLIQQITAACYNLHDTFITSSPAERCSVIAADRARRRVLATRPTSRVSRPEDR